MFKDLVFTPNEFAQLAKLDKSLVSAIEGQGLITTHRKRIGNVDRKVISLEEVQKFFQMIREFDTQEHEAKKMGAGAEVAGTAMVVSDALASLTKNAAAHPSKKLKCFTMLRAEPENPPLPRSLS